MKNYNRKLFYRFLAGIAAVNVKTQDEYDQFMRALEKETVLKWALGHKPTHFHGWTLNKEKTCVRCVTDSETILSGSTSYYESKGYEIIDFSDLMKKENNMKFKVGDKVKVRSWGSMKEEFGLDWDGDIPTSKNCFLSSMRKYCGKILTISEVDMNYGLYCLEGCGEYVFDDGMLEPAKAERKGLLEPLDSEEVKKRKEVEEPFRKLGWFPVHNDLFHSEDFEKYQTFSDDTGEIEEDFITLLHKLKMVELENSTNKDGWLLSYEEIKMLYNRIIQVEKEAQ